MSQVTEKHHLSKLKAVIETYSYVKPSWIYIQASGLESLYVFGRAETFTFITAHFLRASNYEIMVNAVLKRRASDCLLWAPRCCAPMKSRSVERCAPCVSIYGNICCWCETPALAFALERSKGRLVYYSASVLMTGRARWLMASCCFNGGRFHVVTRKHAFGFPNGFWDWCRLPRLIIPSRITPKPSSPPVERGPRMPWMCPRSGGRRRGVLRARPAVQIQIGDWLFSLSCGVGLRYIRHTEVWRSLPLWLFGLVLRPCPWVTLLGGWATATPPPPPVPSHSLKAGSVWDGRQELSATQRASSHGSQEQPFIMWLPEARVSSQPWFPPPPPSSSPSLKGVSVFAPVTVVTQALRSRRPVMGWVQSSNICPYLLLSGGLFIPPFLPSWSLLLV